MKALLVLVIVGLFLSSATYSQKLSSKKVPAAVMTAFTQKFPTATKAKWEHESKTEYETVFKMNGKLYSAIFDNTGKWLETETAIEVADIPADLVKAVNSKYPGYKLKSVDVSETSDKGKIYDITITKGKKKISIDVTQDGKIIENNENEKDEKD